MGTSGVNNPKYKPYNNVRLNARAIIEGWDVPLEDRPVIVKELVGMAKAAESDRDRLRACEALMKIPGMQLAAAQTLILQEKWKREKLGGADVGPGLIEEADERRNKGNADPVADRDP